MNMNIRRLTPADRPAFMEMSARIVDALDNKDMLIPMSEEETDVTFDEGSEDIVLGGSSEGQLVATLSLLHDISDYNNLLPDKYNVLRGAEIGEAMVLPEFRRGGMMNKLGQELMKYILSGNYDFILATAHPDNAASNHMLNASGFELQCVFSRRGYTRNMYLIEVKR